VNTFFERIGHFFARFADACEDDLVGRHTSGARPAQLAFRHHVHAGAQPRHGGEYRLIGIGFDREADQRIETLRDERVGQHLIVPLKRRRRVHIKRRADLPRDLGEADIFGVQDAVYIVEVVHGS
jgi:hypothetical protein